MIRKDYYKILEIAPAATPDAIKQAYRRLAFKYHPDKTFGDPLAENKFKDVVEAYETLSDKHKKINYDYDYHKKPGHVTTMARPAQGAPTQAAQLTPHSLLKTFIEVRKAVESVDSRGKKVKQDALYKRLYELLCRSNIDLIHAGNNPKINQQIINNVLKCCQFLSYTYVEDLSVKLARLAGADNVSIQKIYEFNRKKKRWHLLERHREKFAVGFIILSFICVLLLLISL